MNVIRIARDRALPVLLLFVLLLAVAACTPAATTNPPAAVGSAAGEEAPAATTDETAAEDASGETRHVTDAAGNELDIPANPQRVVVLSERDMDAAFALGFPVVGVVNGRGAETPPAYLQPYLGDAVSMGAFSAPSPEAILNLDPDLILIGGLFPELEAQLPAFNEIAPVYVTFQSGADWRTSFMGAADALNRTAEAEAWLADYDARAAALAAALPAGAPISIVRFNPDGPVIMSPNSFASTITSSLGLTRPEAHMSIEGAGHGDTISKEAIAAINADHIFMGALNPDGTAVLEAAQADPLYAALPAFQNGEVSVVDGAVWTSLGGPLAAQTILDDVAAAFGVSE